MKRTAKKIYGLQILETVKRRYVREKVPFVIRERLFKLVFLCGKKLGNDTTPGNRQKVLDLLTKNRKDVKCINVEDFTTEFLKEMDLLTFEEFIALLCDSIILFAESYGSVCELGAFVSRESVAKKMTVVNDKKYAEEKSFINRGPLKRLKGFGENKVVYLDIDDIFAHKSFQEIIFNCVPTLKQCDPNENSQEINLVSFMHEVLDIIWVFGPIPSNHIVEIYKFLKGFDSFQFINSDAHGNLLGEKINPTHILRVLELLDFVRNDKRYYSIGIEKASLGFFFSLSDKEYQLLRSRVVARKYKHKDWYGNETAYANIP